MTHVGKTQTTRLQLGQTKNIKPSTAAKIAVTQTTKNIGGTTVATTVTVVNPEKNTADEVEPIAPIGGKP